MTSTLEERSDAGRGTSWVVGDSGGWGQCLGLLNSTTSRLARPFRTPRTGQIGDRPDVGTKYTARKLLTNRALELEHPKLQKSEALTPSATNFTSAGGRRRQAGRAVEGLTPSSSGATSSIARADGDDRDDSRDGRVANERRRRRRGVGGGGAGRGALARRARRRCGPSWSWHDTMNRAKIKAAMKRITGTTLEVFAFPTLH